MTALVLWDVDHTLIENSGVSKETYALAFRLLTGRAATARPVTDGRTDGLIMRDLFAAHGLPFPGDRRTHDALRTAMDRNAEALRLRGYALPGAAEAVAALGALPGVVQSVLTGNIAYNARAKLVPFGLAEALDLPVGGYADDHTDRPRLVAAAQRKATAAYGLRYGRESTLLIGDTPRDAEAGREGGARVLGVATGRFTEDELAAAGADRTVPDLKDTATVVAACRELLGH